MLNRRDFLKHGSRSLVGAALGHGAARAVSLAPFGVARPGTSADRLSPGRSVALPIDDPTLRSLATRALDAAHSAGATYADVRFTRTRTQRLLVGTPAMDDERIAAGVRALVNGFWGFVASPEWTADEMARLGRDAAAQARVNNWGVTAAVQFSGPVPAASGTWATPHARDPFAVPDEEKMDYIRAAQAYASTFRNATASSAVSFKRTERVFASTEGAFCTQTVYTALGNGSYFSVDVYDPVTDQSGDRLADFFRPTAGGYEVLTESGLFEAIPQLYEEARRQLTTVPIVPGRYDVVFDATAMAELIGVSIGSATEIDRVRGFEANAGGTSYLSPPAAVLGATLGAPVVSITADRSSPTGAASVGWDDDGVVPDTFTLVDQGVLVDYATSREHVATLAPWYESRRVSLRSHGCAGAESAGDIPLVQTPNLRMTPAEHDLDFDMLVAGVDEGLAVVGGSCQMDFRALTGQGEGGVVYQIKNGRLGAVVTGGAYLIRATEFWRNVAAVGGARSVRWCGRESKKGEPSQQIVHSVAAVPTLVHNVLFTDELGRVR